MSCARFAIRFDAWYLPLSTALWLRPADSYVEVGPDDVEVCMGWAFRARFARSAVAGAAQGLHGLLSRGVHGFGGSWLVNGSGRGIVTIQLASDQSARVIGVRVRLRTLLVSVEDPEALIQKLTIAEHI